MIRSILFILICCCFIGIELHGQVSMPERALVSYRDGSYFIGDILLREGPIWHFKLSTGDTIHLETKEIAEYLSSSEVFFYSHRRYHARKSLFATSSLAFHAGWESSVHWDGTIGLSLNERFDVGAGLGVSGHEIDMGDNWVYNDFLNLFGYGRYYLNKRAMRLYVDAKLGYAAPMFNEWEQDSHTGGLYFQPGFGVVLASRGHLKWHFGLSQYLLHTKGTSTSWGFSGNTLEVDYNVWYNRTVFQFGVSAVFLPRELGGFSLF